jgi:hypothetical protein
MSLPEISTEVKMPEYDDRHFWRLLEAGKFDEAEHCARQAAELRKRDGVADADGWLAYCTLEIAFRRKADSRELLDLLTSLMSMATTAHDRIRLVHTAIVEFGCSRDDWFGIVAVGLLDVSDFEAADHGDWKGLFTSIRNLAAGALRSRHGST